MANYDFKYELAKAPTATNDGSGMIIHEIWAVARAQGAPTQDPFFRVGLHKEIAVPFAEMKVVMDMPHNNGSAKSAKNSAYKDMLASNLNTGSEPIVGWTKVELEARLDANDNAVLETGRADDYITDTLGVEYPVQFSI